MGQVRFRGAEHREGGPDAAKFVGDSGYRQGGNLRQRGMTTARSAMNWSTAQPVAIERWGDGDASVQTSALPDRLPSNRLSRKAPAVTLASVAGVISRARRTRRRANLRHSASSGISRSSARAWRAIGGRVRPVRPGSSDRPARTAREPAARPSDDRAGSQLFAADSRGDECAMSAAERQKPFRSPSSAAIRRRASRSSRSRRSPRRASSSSRNTSSC